MPKGKAIGLCGRVLVITELSNGPGGNCEYVELYVAKCSLYPDAAEVDVRGWIVDDNANNFNSGGDCVGNFLTSAGHLRFADNPTWESVPVGSIIVLYNTVDNASCFNFTADLAGSGGVYYIPVGSTGLMEASSNAPTSSSCDYCTATYASYNPWWGIVTDTDRDAIQVRCPGCGEGDGGPAFYQGLSWGLTDMGPIAPGSNDLGGAHMHMGGRGRTFILDTDDVEDIKAGLGWTSTTAVASRPTAGSVSAELRAALLGSPLPCCGNFEPPVVVQKQQYRFGFGGQMKDDEIYGATGTSYAFEYRMHDARVGRFLSVDPLASKYPHNSPYAFAENKLGLGAELEGLELGPMPVEVWKFGHYVEQKMKDAQQNMSEVVENAGQVLGQLGNWLKGLSGDGGYTMTSRKRDVPTNNSDRKGDPSGEFNVDYLLDYTGATRNGPERFGPTLPERGAQTFTEGYNKLWEAGNIVKSNLTSDDHPNSGEGGRGGNTTGVTTVRDYQVNRSGDTISVASPDGRWNGDKYAPGDTIEIRDVQYRDGNYVGETSTKKSGR